MEGLQELTNALSNGTIPDPLRPLLEDWGFATPTKNSNCYIISGKDEATNFKFGGNIYTVHRNKNPLTILVKREHGVSRDCTNFWVPPIMKGTGEATNFKFGWSIHSVHPNKNPL